MDLQAVDSIFKFMVDNHLSAYEFSLLIALAHFKFNENAECSPSICELVSACGMMSERQTLRTLAGLKSRGIISVVGKRKTKTGECNVYKFNFSPATTGQAPSIVQSLTGQAPSIVQSLTGASTVYCAVLDGVNSGIINNLDNVCAITACAHTRTRAHTREGLGFDVAALSDVLKIPRDYVSECLTKWGAAGWVTTQGKPITPKTIRAHLLAFWEHEKNKAAYLKPAKPARKFTAKDWELCHDRCIHWKAGGGCVFGVAVPPDHDETRKAAPDECKRFEPTEEYKKELEAKNGGKVRR